MAVTSGQNPIICTAVNDTLPGPMHVVTIRVVALGTGGAFVIKNAAETQVIFTGTLTTTSADQLVIRGVIQGFKVTTLPTSALVFFYVSSSREVC